MIICKCPVRVSLIGGSTDLDSFLTKYEKGSVISLPCSLNTYISLHENHRNKFIINYSSNEEVENISGIKNDVARVVLEHFSPSEYLSIGFNSDIFSVGSGLAASSSYMIALIKAMCVYLDRPMSDFDICELALNLERKFNPLTGQQDPYGCGMMDFKRMNFTLTDRPTFSYLPGAFLDELDMYLLYTGQTRNSTKVLKSIDTNEVNNLVNLVDDTQRYILSFDYTSFYKIIREGWKKKKKSSSQILANKNLVEIDDILLSNNLVKAHKLCGAGGGGHFLIFTEKLSPLIDSLGQLNKWVTEVKVTSGGLTAKRI